MNDDTTYTLVTDRFGNVTFFEDGRVPAEVHGQPVEIITTGLSWEDAHANL